MSSFQFLYTKFKNHIYCISYASAAHRPNIDLLPRRKSDCQFAFSSPGLIKWV